MATQCTYRGRRSRPLNRRSILIGIIGVAASALLTAWGGGVTLEPRTPTRATTVSAGGAGTLAPRRAAAAAPVDCNAVTAAYRDFGHSIPLMLTLTPESNYGAYTDPASYGYLDFAKLRADLDTLATLPDAADATFGKKASDTIPEYRRLVDRAERNVKAGGNPFDDGSADGQPSSGPNSPLITDFAAVSNAYSAACS
jgi:hypothetical protein